MNRTTVLSRAVRRWVTAVSAFAMVVTLAATGASATNGMEQVDGTAVPWPVAPTTCDPTAYPADYILAFPAGSGDLVGCLYGVRGDVAVQPSGTLQFRATETFAGCIGDACGTFDLDAFVTNKWDGAPGPDGNQIFGRCQHRIVPGSGTGDFEGINGRLDFKDDILRDDSGQQIGVLFDFRGHIRL